MYLRTLQIKRQYKRLLNIGRTPDYIYSRGVGYFPIKVAKRVTMCDKSKVTTPKLNNFT